MKTTGRKVLVVINLFSSAENFVGGQFGYLRENGYEMHLICSPDEGLDAFALQQGIRYRAIPLNRQLTPWQDLKSLILICRYIRRYKIDTVIGHQVKGRLLATLASFITRVPHVVIFAHGAIFETAMGLKKHLLIAESRLESALSDKVVCVSGYIRDIRKSLKIDRPDKQFILGAGTCGGIDTSRQFNPDCIGIDTISRQKSKYGIKPDDFVIGFVGRLVRDKGVIELIDAFKILKDRFPDRSLKLMVVGSPEKRDGLPQPTLDFLRLADDVVYTGHVPHEDMGLQYLCMDCLILPSYREGFGFCNIEAQAMGVPVLTTRITGCRDSIIDNSTGLYIDLAPEDIAKKTELLFNESFRTELGRRGKQWVRKNFDHTKVWPYVKELLDNMTVNK